MEQNRKKTMRISMAVCLIFVLVLTVDICPGEHLYCKASEKAVPVLAPVSSSEEPQQTLAPPSGEPQQTLAPVSSSEEPQQTSAPPSEEPQQTPVPSSVRESVEEDEDEEEDEEEDIEVEELQLKVKKSAIKVSWEKVPGASGYELCYSTSQKFKQKNVKVTKKTNLTIGKLKVNQSYFIKVRAYKIKEGQKKYGDWSNTEERRIVTEKHAYAVLKSLRKKYPEGKSLTDYNFSYYSFCFGGGRGCYAFAAKVSDTVYGKGQPYKTHSSFKKIRVGDNIRIGGYHSVIVLTKGKDYITVVEGNYNSAVHWNRKITASYLSSKKFKVYSRY